ncbi:hypothetical protein COU62_01520 [Candidatus Pacearchaeota archaeon CG10_big_fil_rev_8_21_14_0_10_35_219]|nr:MAG: hypothetical protein COU62_01520 [Candidatus Pacearchaeota archaeon CG10_big_fil_rev_8_21_14_0_10_35_219]PIY81559.1 MAG: hypothetical protein COY79_02360 [Candidatus Pacearchaeota archaeon CG_4_10_14_0_8_um_filter_35_169]PIZ78934.1 MAG: hypothetical protein COY00_04745 [Candidatus Pacearchaeota archaeon CG_4_10_14_0_2_um_filter_35_33]PJA69731.1 MAG: hypothetical protein CO155_04025 [Candidatus Pacearchaeota archaeon CG_4_9_14_3_um_filter_35_19]PJB94198.1 MAG: hypothetical protein CO081_
MRMHHHIKRLKKHRNVLYGLVIVLVVFQIVVFFVFTSQTSRLISEQERANEYFENKISNELGGVREEMKANINELANVISQNSEDFQQEINLLKSTRDDFSGVVEESIKGVVTISTERASGSGFFVHSSGYIVTNWHVLDGSNTMKVIDYSGNEINAELIGMDDFTDLALLKVPGIYNHLDLANSDDIQIGETVIAIGNPLGLAFTVTEGIVSAIDREGPNGLEAYVQTDVTLNPGNSGGPLINKEGKVVGVNNFKIGGAESLGFALESDVVKERINMIANQTIIE